jgi:hypothetical protein
MSADTASKVDLAFWYLRSKYCSWWLRRVSTPELEAAERAEWGRVLGSYSRKQIKDAAFVMRRDFKFRPPRTAEFARLMDRRAARPMDAVTGRRFDRPVHTDVSMRSLGKIKAMLGGA